MQANAFLEQHSARLVEIANGASKALLGDNAVSRFLERLHADFETVEDKPGRRPSLPGEDVFWWCITILEELAEMRGSNSARDPYVVMMLDQLRGMGTRLANAEPLPPEFQIHWFDDTDDPEDTDD